MTAATMNITNVLTDAEESIGPVVKEVERTFCFTDVPCGAMKLNKDEETKVSGEVKDEGLFKFCGGLERAFCFTDLQDVDESDIERLKSMKSAMENEATLTKEEQPGGVEASDTESLSDDSANKEGNEAKAITVAPVDDKKIGKPVGAAVPAAANATKSTVKKAKAKASETILPPANALQASTRKLKGGKPLNALQAAKEAKKKDGSKKKRKSWGLFRKSNKATV